MKSTLCQSLGLAESNCLLRPGQPDELGYQRWIGYAALKRNLLELCIDQNSSSVRTGER